MIKLLKLILKDGHLNILEPADLFRTMEDATGEDLDWFWRGWFYSTDPVDIAIDKVTVATPDFDGKPQR